MKAITLFCGRCNTVTDQQIGPVGNEFVSTCQTEGCGHTLKFPKVATAAELQTMIDQHNADNKPAVTAVDVANENQAMLDLLDAL